MNLTFAISFLLVCGAVSVAQTASTAKSAAAPAATKDPVATSLRMLVQRSQGNTVSGARSHAGGKLLSSPHPTRSCSRISPPTSRVLITSCALKPLMSRLPMWMSRKTRLQGSASLRSQSVVRLLQRSIWARWTTPNWAIRLNFLEAASFRARWQL